MAVQLKKQQTVGIKKEEATPKKSLDAGTVNIRVIPEFSKEELDEFTKKVLKDLQEDLEREILESGIHGFPSSVGYRPPYIWKNFASTEEEEREFRLTQFQRVILSIVLSGLGFFLLLAIFGTGWQDARSAVYYSTFDAFTVCLQIWILHLALFWVFYDLLRDFSE